MPTSLRYYLHGVKADSDSRIRLTAIEYLTDGDGQEHECPLLITLGKEDDGVWRAIKERVLSKDEAQAAGLSRLH